MVTYDSLSLLGLGFIAGFCIAFVSFLIALFTGKEMPLVKKGLLIMGAILILIFVPPIGKVAKIWLIITLFLAALVINYLLDTLFHLGIFHKVPENKIKLTSQAIYALAILIAIIIIATGSMHTVEVTFEFTKQIIIFLLGLLLALKLLLTKKDHSR